MPTTVSAVQAFLAELKRRRVFRVAAVYAATAFVAWQAADIAIPALHLPARTVVLVAVLLVSGGGVGWILKRGPVAPAASTAGEHLVLVRGGDLYSDLVLVEAAPLRRAGAPR